MFSGTAALPIAYRRILFFAPGVWPLLFILMLTGGCGRPAPPDPAMVSLAARATLDARPTPTPRVVEVTRQVEVTRIVEVTRVVEVTRLVEVVSTATPAATTQPTASPTPQAAAPAQPEASVAAAAAPAPRAAPNAPCATTSDRVFALIPVTGPSAEHPDSIHGDLNLGLRGYEPVDATLGIVEINGPTDGDPPQLAGLFGDGRTPRFSSAHQVRDWNWSCGAHGCRGDLLNSSAVTLLGMAVQPGEAIQIPARGAQIYAGGFKALVLYAEERRITLGYTREDSVANGYAIHLENVCVDPNLLASYRKSNGEGRRQLPALRNGEVLGSASTGEIAVAVRDRGRFFDPRSRKDWWR